MKGTVQALNPCFIYSHIYPIMRRPFPLNDSPSTPRWPGVIGTWIGCQPGEDGPLYVSIHAHKHQRVQIARHVAKHTSMPQPSSSFVSGTQTILFRRWKIPLKYSKIRRATYPGWELRLFNSILCSLAQFNGRCTKRALLRAGVCCVSSECVQALCN